MCFFIRLFSKQNFEPRIFKKRQKLSQKFRLYNSFISSTNCYLTFFLLKEFRFELIQFQFIRRGLKKCVKKPYLLTVFPKKILWVFWKANYPLTKKSKNSRMGKGKGVFLRWSIRLPMHFKLFEFYYYSSKSRAQLLLKFLKYKLTPVLYFQIR